MTVVESEKNTGNRIQSDRKAAVEHWSGGEEAERRL